MFVCARCRCVSACACVYRLFDVRSPYPLRVWDNLNASSIVRVRWCPIRPAVFFVMDVVGLLYTFDIVRDPLVRPTAPPLSHHTSRWT